MPTIRSRSASVEGIDGRKRADAGGEEDLGLEDVADAGENPLIEQHFRDCISTVGAHPPDNFRDVDRVWYWAPAPASRSGPSALT